MTPNRWRTIVEPLIAAGEVWDGSSDPIVIAAVALVRRHGFDRPALDAGRITVGALSDCEGATTARGRILIAANAEAYRYALSGDLRPLAGVVAHEVAHLDGGDEFDASAIELHFLSIAGSPDAWWRFIRTLALKELT